MFRRRVKYRTVPVAPRGIHIDPSGVYWTVRNNLLDPIRITWTQQGTDEQRSQDIPAGSIAPFHTADGRFRADLIEVL